MDRREVPLNLRLAADEASSQHIREPENRIHGGADLVAHVREEGAFRMVGVFGGQLRPMQFDLLILKLGDVIKTGQHPAVLAIVPEHRGTVHAEGANSKRGVTQLEHHIRLRRFGLERDRPGHPSGERRAIEIEPAEFGRFSPHQGLGRFAYQVRECLVGQHDPPLTVENEQAFGQRIEGRANPSGNRLRGVDLPQHAPQIEIERAERDRRGEQNQLRRRHRQKTEPAGWVNRGEPQFNRAPLLGAGKNGNLNMRVDRPVAFDVGPVWRMPQGRHFQEQLSIGATDAGAENLGMTVLEHLEHGLEADEVLPRHPQ